MSLPKNYTPVKRGMRFIANAALSSKLKGNSAVMSV